MKVMAQCTRCNHENLVDVPTAVEAEKLENGIKRKLEAKKKILEFLKSIPAEDMPDYVVALGGEVVVHSSVCDGENKKRSCKKRLRELFDQADELSPRAPRKPKEKPIPLTNEAPAAPKDDSADKKGKK